MCVLLQVISDTKELVSSRVADAKDAVSSRVMEVIDVTKEALQSGMEAARSAVTSSVGMVMDSEVGQTAVSGADAVLGETEDSSLPIANEELGKETIYGSLCSRNHQTGWPAPFLTLATLEWG